MQMIMNVVKNTIELMVLLMVVGALIRFFLRRTLIGRLILLTCRNIHLFLKLCLRMSRHTIRIIYTDGKRLNDYIYRCYRSYEQKNIDNENYENVIDLDQAKKRHSNSKSV